MKILVVAMLITIVQASPPTPRKAPDNQTASSQSVTQDADGKQAPPSQSPSTLHIVKPAPDKRDGQDVASDNTSKAIRVVELPSVSVTRDRIDCITLVFSAALLVVGSIGVRAAYRTLSAIEKQTVELARSVTETAKAATATRDSADALVNSERPWVTATIRKREYETAEIGRDHQPTGRKLVAATFDFFIKNLGRTPAEILAIRGAPELIDSGKGPAGGLTTDSIPDYGNAMLQQVWLLAPNEERRYDVDGLYLKGWGEKEHEAIGHGTRLVLFKGQVVYRDTLRPKVEHETRFCYTYFRMTDDFRPSGPSQYTTYT